MDYEFVLYFPNGQEGHFSVPKELSVRDVELLHKQISNALEVISLTSGWHPTKGVNDEPVPDQKHHQ